MEYLGTAIADTAGNPLEKFPSLRITNNIAPTVVLFSDITHSGGTVAVNEIPFTVTFSGEVTGFNATSDIILSGSANPTASVPIGEGTTYAFVVTTTTDGTVTITIPAGVATDTNGNPNDALFSYVFTVDTTHQIYNRGSLGFQTTDTGTTWYI